MDLIGRARELESVESILNSDRFECLVVYGRRRIGKTALLTEAIKRRPAIYFVGVEANARRNLELLSHAIWEGFSTPGAGTFDSELAALEYVFENADGRDMTLVIDEYPNVARAIPSFGSVLQMLIDEHHKTSSLKVILCGSSTSFMEEEVLGRKAPLYGRRTAQMKLKPLDFASASQFWPELNPEDKVAAYGMLGGTPQYLEQFRKHRNINENLLQSFLQPAAFMYDEPGSYLRETVRDPSPYNDVLSAIASGASKMNEIATKVGRETGAVTKTLGSLQMLDLVRKEAPVGERNSSRRTIYRISDNAFRFWYRFIFPNVALIERGAGRSVLGRILPELSDYLSPVFEDICQEYLWHLYLKGQSLVDLQDMGRWWGTDAAAKAQAEIDIVAPGVDGKILLGECKWTAGAVDTKTIDKLRSRSALFPSRNPVFYVFAKNGFTDAAQRSAGAAGDVHLVSLPEITEVLGAGR